MQDLYHQQKELASIETLHFFCRLHKISMLGGRKSRPARTVRLAKARESVRVDPRNPSLRVQNTNQTVFRASTLGSVFLVLGRDLNSHPSGRSMNRRTAKILQVVLQSAHEELPASSA